MNNDQLINHQDYDVQTYDASGLPEKQLNNALNKNYFFTAQGNYIHPMVSGARIEAGYKYSLRDMGMNYDYSNYDNETNVYVPNINLKNHYDFKEQIAALYGIYSNTCKKLKYQGGIRYEQVYSDSKVEQTNKTYNNTYHIFYPSLHTQYDLGKVRELQFSYSRRVDRPSPRHMNPYVDYSDSLNISQGNPDLKPEYTNSLELGVLKYWDKYSLTSTAFFRNTSALVEDITRIDSTGVTYSMPQNISNSKSYGFEFVASANPYKWLRLNGNLSFYQYWVSALPEQFIPETNQFT